MSASRQIRTLIKKDFLIVVYRRWFSTFVRALVFPIILTFIISYIRIWTQSSGEYGIGQPTPVQSFTDALASTGRVRNRIVICNGGVTTGNIGTVVDRLSTTIKQNGKDLHLVTQPEEITELCPSSSRGVTDCFGAVDFQSAPDHGPGAQWNYTMYGDGAFSNQVDVKSSRNDYQVYTLPFQRAIDEAIASVGNVSSLEQPILQYAYTYENQTEKQTDDFQSYQGFVQGSLALVFFIGISGITYHAVGHIAQQREKGILQLIDAMMPNSNRWARLAIRNLATHIVFDVVYLPGFIISGVVLAVVAFPDVNAGYLIALNILTCLSLMSYCLLVSSLFKKAQLSAISSIVAAIAFAIVAQFALGTGQYSSNAGVYATSFLFPPSAYVFFLISVANYELEGVQFNVNQPAPDIPFWSISPAIFLGFLAIQFIIFPILGAIIETFLHGVISRARKVKSTSEMNGKAIKLLGFSKHFRAVKAVENLTLELQSGTITALLGANGSGKSTTLNAIAGLETITHGSIEIDREGSLGLCPQRNVMWDELTVKEHVEIFEALKRPISMQKDARKNEIQRMIHGCDLEVKAFALAKTLSGGQKRKLQLAMMLSGGSTVCCIDEASSGIDPLARRAIWDILLTERGSRTLLLTTHFLDEAEVLADHVAILSKGQLKAQGSVAGLKSQFGDGYQIILDNTAEISQIAETASISRHLDYDHVVFRTVSSTSLASFVAQLEQRGIKDYSIRGPTIEHVFLKLAEEMQNEPEIYDEVQVSNGLKEKSSSKLESREPFLLDTGAGCGPWKQTLILFRKRFTILKYNYMPYVSALFVTLTIAGLVTRFFIGTSSAFTYGVPCSSPDTQYSYTLTLNTYQISAGEFIYGPPSRISVNDIKRFVPESTSYSAYGMIEPIDYGSIPTANTITAFNSEVAKTTPYTGGIFESNGTTLFAWEGQYGAAMLVQTLVDQLLLNQTINFGYTEFSQPYTLTDNTNLYISIFTVLGFTIYPGLFALYPTAERLRKVRAMQYSNGILPSSLWLAYLLFDAIFILIISGATAIIWFVKFQGWYGLGYLFLVFCLYGLASTALSYVVSLLVKSQLGAIAATTVMQFVVAALYFVGYLLISNNATELDRFTYFNDMAYTIGLISPAANLLRATFVAFNSYSLACKGSSLAPYPGAIDLYGLPILYLILQLVVLALFLIYWESGRSLEIFGIRRHRKSTTFSNYEAEKLKGPSNPETDEDPIRLAPESNGLSVQHISKSFGSNRAVDDMTFGILPSEKFALLGPNGAGKSTMISLIRGDLSQDHASHGTIHIENDSLYKNPVAAKNHLGVCPQFDATDTMTLSDHLNFYARARGVPNPSKNINELISRLGLEPHKDKLVRKLSGGTHRKLSLAIALISNPRVLLLDEPSSGMDPAAKRMLWDTLSHISEGRVVLLTTHSMEEASNLCDRAGIMASKMLALGSIEDLKQRYGKSIYVHLVHANAPYTNVQDMERVQQDVLRKFPAAQLDRRAFGGQLRFRVPQDGVPGQDETGSMRIGRVFGIVEEMKEDWGIVDYAIGHATLDQVFLNVVGRHNVQEENTEVKKGEWWKVWRFLK